MDSFDDESIKIPIIDGKFEYVLITEHVERYNLLVFDIPGLFNPISFFSEGGVINFTLFPDDRFNETIVEGGRYTELRWNYLKALEAKWDAMDLKIQQMEKDNVAVDVSEIRQLFHYETNAFSLQFIKENPNIAGYSVLLSRAGIIAQGDIPGFDLLDISPYVELYKTVFKPKFPNHPKTEEMERILTPPLPTMVGTPFVDFTAPDLNGNPVTLSERISGSPALLWLWASWCSPCIRKGIEIIPVYEEFRDKGFVVIGVARERDVTSAKVAIERHRFPWENLVDLRDAQGIWEKYQMEGRAGAEFLIDENGIIVAKDPTIEEIRSFLVNKFQ